MPVALDKLNRLQARKDALFKAQTNSFWLGTEILHYDRLTTTYHKPMMDEDDLRDRQRPLVKEWCPRIALPGRSYVKDELNLEARDHFKTTRFIIRCCKMALIYPEVAISLWHMVEEKAQETAAEIGNHFLKNDDFRRLMPEIMPAKTARRFLTASGFTLRRKNFRRHPTVYAKGAGAEVTGGHSDIGWLDDVIGQGTIDDSGMPRVRNWLGNTVRHVVRTDGGWLWCTGTRWDPHDIYQDFLDSETWDSRVRAALETDGKPDYQGKSVLYEQAWIEKKQKDTNCNFDAQMMNDPSPVSEKPWNPKTCEHYITLKEAAGVGSVFILSDTSPKNIGTEDTSKAKYRGDGKKDFWSNAVVKLRTRGERNEIILLDGSMSQGWDDIEGFTEMARLQKRWHANGIGIENKGQQFKDMIARELRRICRVEGARYCPVELVSTPAGKNARFGYLASRARQDELLICDTVPKGYLDRFLQQARDFRVVDSGKGKNSLQYDDEIDAVSYACDPAFANRFVVVVAETPDWDAEEDDQFVSRARYCVA